MAKKDYKTMANDIIDVVGGEKNIANVTHCMTRLRLQLVDATKLNQEEKTISQYINNFSEDDIIEYIYNEIEDKNLG